MALHRRSTSLPCDSRRPLLQHSESDMSSVLQTRAPPEDRLPIFTGRKAWETWVNSSPSMRARIEEQDGHDINENDGFGTKYPEFVPHEANNGVLEDTLRQYHTGRLHNTRSIHSRLGEHDVKSDLATIGSLSRLSLNQHVPLPQSSLMSPPSSCPARQTPCTSPDRLRSSRDSSPKGLTSLHSYNRSPSKPRSPLRQTVIMGDSKEKLDTNIDIIKEDFIMEGAMQDKKRSFLDSLGSLGECFVLSSEDKADTATKNRNISLSPTRLGAFLTRTQNLSPKHKYCNENQEYIEDLNRGRTSSKTMRSIYGSPNSERGRSRNARTEPLQTSSQSNHGPSRWRSLSCYSADTSDMSDKAKDSGFVIAQAHRRSCSTSHSPSSSHSQTRQSPSGRRHKHRHRRHGHCCHEQTKNIPQTSIVSSSFYPLQHNLNCENKDVIYFVGSNGEIRQPNYIHHHVHYVMSGRRRSVSESYIKNRK